MSRFEDELWETLVRDHGAASVQRGSHSGDGATSVQGGRRSEGESFGQRGSASARVARRRRLVPLAVAAAALVLATATVVALMSAGSGPSAAYAVVQNPDGSVTLTLDEVLGVTPADEELARLGVRAVVAKVEAGCNEVGQTVTPPRPGSVREMVETAKVGDGLANAPKGLGGLTWVIHPAAIPPGDTLRLSVQIDPYSRIPAVGGSLALFRGAAPRCSRPGIFYPG
jgi:hypothetical protein